MHARRLRKAHWQLHVAVLVRLCKHAHAFEEGGCPLGHFLAQHQTFRRRPSTAVVLDVEGSNHRLAGLVGGEFERVPALVEVGEWSALGGGEVFEASNRVPTARLTGLNPPAQPLLNLTSLVCIYVYIYIYIYCLLFVLYVCGCITYIYIYLHICIYI